MNSVLCRFFAQGVCREGDACPFSHDRTKGKPDTVCRFYLKGMCSYGDGCRYDHVKPQKRYPDMPSSKYLPRTPRLEPADTPSLSIPEMHPPLSSSSSSTTNPSSFGDHSYADIAKKNHDEDLGHAAWRVEDGIIMDGVAEALCPFAYATGYCPQPSCPYLHGLECPSCHALCLHPMQDEHTHYQTHIEQCMAYIAEYDRMASVHAKHVEDSRGVECGVCLEPIAERPDISRRVFGILSSCSHSFCLDCIRLWRSTPLAGASVRCCPICRINSYFVIPSSVWIADAEEKERLVAEYKEKLAKKDCRRYDFGNGNCPFGESCFYKHVDKNGFPEVKRLRFIGGEDGAYKPMKGVRLSDFFSARDATF